MPSPCTVGYCMPTALYSIYATVGLHVTVLRMPVLKLYESLRSVNDRWQEGHPLENLQIQYTCSLYVYKKNI